MTGTRLTRVRTEVGEVFLAGPKPTHLAVPLWFVEDLSRVVGLHQDALEGIPKLADVLAKAREIGLVED